MITNSFKNIFTALPLYFLQDSTYGAVPIIAYDGNKRYYGRAVGTLGNNPAVNLSTDGAGIKLGSGTTPPTTSDYCMESVITGGASASVVNKTKSVDQNNHACYTFEITVTNTGSDSLTISEVGIYLSVGMTTNSGGTSSTTRSVMLDRTLLDTPITIPVGEAAVITYTLKFGDIIDIT